MDHPRWWFDWCGPQRMAIEDMDRLSFPSHGEGDEILDLPWVFFKTCSDITKQPLADTLITQFKSC